MAVGVPVSLALALLGLPAPTIGLGGTEAWVRSAVTGLSSLAYYAVLESTTRATVGKRLLGLRVVDAAGRAPGALAAAKRNAWILLGLVPILGGIALLIAVVVMAATIVRNPQHRGAHDVIAGTAVVRRAAP